MAIDTLVELTKNSYSGSTRYNAAPNPPGLQRVLAFAQDNQRKFMQGIASGLGLLPCSFHFFGREACYAWNC